MALLQEELEQAAKNVGEINNVKDLQNHLITLSLQKLEFKGEQYHKFIPQGTADVARIQVTKANLQYLHNQAVKLNAPAEFVKIIDKWKQGDFSDMLNDYALIREVKPEESAAIKMRTEEEEQEYIKHFFGDKGLEIHNRDWK
ncbi:DUF6241 domain-containing protein [Neobacillus sedimentimangrovi]|uniref:DUF6241 domain-containing protein n=1 Tax=Neobacillus sedimentimangrovi TaxID=2699460 RepID=A0ABS8QE94_9BACI|nr:DUF6241 domain-containing protein [Neobacillus sedimentimangrovi]MCD4837575.1 DUF6241 domain-containing protein [Neobacillus sedimentimangrovi]